ncbi:hypothetical protein E4U57_000487 [Claviceps arundinis]|uniref:Uncharacterized protein n=1 Tax=Claviceps arundinis TaxID=1623583 RepID=A0ABQ7PCX0_9HYPO|nr:hypothetical protein E4U57_000487 [Claviceps arundinis]
MPADLRGHGDRDESNRDESNRDESNRDESNRDESNRDESNRDEAPLEPPRGSSPDDSGTFLDPLSVIPPANFVKRISSMGYDMYIYRLFWNALKPSTRKTYSAATRSYETFCEHHRRTPYPVVVVLSVHAATDPVDEHDSLNRISFV